MRQNGHKPRAVLYARVSTRDQKKGTSPEGQLQRGREYALTQGYEVVAEELDVISGSFVLARSSFNEYLEMLSENQADVIVVDIPDRLGRGDAIAKCELLAELSGGSIEYATPGRDESTVEGMALKATDMLVSGIERINIRRRTMSGRNAWARKGRVIASSYRPYGYEFDKAYDPATGRKLDCNLVPVDDEAEIVRQMYRWCAYEGLTTYAIAKRLTKQGVLTLSDKDDVSKRKSGRRGQWHRGTVHGILTNATYKGIWRYRKNKVDRVDTPDGVKTEVTKRDKEETIAIEVPPIVSDELWELAQKRLKKNAKRNHKPTKYEYLLRGRLRCGKCESAMNAASRTYKGKRNWHYRCGLKYRFGVDAPNACDARNVEGPMIEAAIWGVVVELMLDEGRLFDKISAERKRKQEALKGLQRNIAALEMQNRKDGAAIDRLLDLYLGGELDKERFVTKQEELEQAIAQRNDELAEARGHMSDKGALSPEREAELRRLRAEVATRLEHATFEQKEQLLGALQVEATYHDESGQVVITGVFGRYTLESVRQVESGDEEGQSGAGRQESASDCVTPSPTFACYRRTRA